MYHRATTAHAPSLSLSGDPSVHKLLNQCKLVTVLLWWFKGSGVDNGESQGCHNPQSPAQLYPASAQGAAQAALCYFI